ncbi:DNA-binding response OmpR family regulator [Sphingomonas kyeonggiensis]|uniref:DNA-binding response OmpR family regulator n=1 Tax=Sphingomonas kyeonggiensis TaxID=1268553 RepID=A0A7W7K0N3_9SPHN|nr:DNA-binding response OmpR family regulator [Sphingomonas kyeonggiensis]
MVEDEPLLAFDTEHFLSGEGFAVAATVDTVAEALRVLAADKDLDLVLADVRLADGSGIEVARAAQGRGLPVLFVTGSFPEEAKVLAAGCLAKPYPQRDLLAAIDAIEAVLEGAKAPRRLPGSFSLFLSPA